MAQWRRRETRRPEVASSRPRWKRKGAADPSLPQTVLDWEGAGAG